MYEAEAEMWDAIAANAPRELPRQAYDVAPAPLELDRKLSLQELRRIMGEDPREMPSDVLSWAIASLEHRLTLIPVGAPARGQYERRLETLNAVEGR